MVSRRIWPLACAVILWALCPCRQLLVRGSAKQARTLQTGQREQIPGRTRTVQERTLPEEFQLRARKLRDEASLAEAALAASRAARVQQESVNEELTKTVDLHEEDDSVARASAPTKPGQVSPPRGEIPARSIISRFATCMVVASFWVFVVAGWYAIAASTIYSAVNDDRMEPVIHGLNHSIHLIDFEE